MTAETMTAKTPLLPLFPPLIPLLVAVLMLLFTDKVEKPGQTAAPTLADDAAFLDDLKRSRTRGLAGIAVVAPASGLRGDNIAKVYELAEKVGVAFPREAIDPEVVPYTANSDETRLELMTKALNDPETEVIWAMRGGYGSSRILEELSRLPAPDKPKVFIGYSDMTFLHLFLHQWKWKTIHGAMFLEVRGKEKDKDNLRLVAEIIAGKKSELRYDGLEPFNQLAKDAAEPITGILTGGNLTCVAAAVGTPWPLDGAGKIIVLEDVKERGYKLDRLLTQLRLAGMFDKAEAVVLGTFSEGDDDVGFALGRFAKECGKPVFKTDMFGHGTKNYPLIFNAPAKIEKSAENGAVFAITSDARQLP